MQTTVRRSVQRNVVMNAVVVLLVGCTPTERQATSLPPEGDVQKRAAQLPGSPPWNRIVPTDVPPWSQIAVMIPGPGDSGGCTCFRAVSGFSCVTAAHCVMKCQRRPAGQTEDIITQYPISPIQFSPGLNTMPPIPANSYGVAVPRAYVRACNDGQFALAAALDYALLRLRGRFDPAPLHDVVSYWGPTVPTVPNGTFPPPTEQMLVIDDVRVGQTGINVEVAGYPGDLPSGWVFPTLAQSRTDTAETVASAAGFIFYLNRTDHGMSGSPVLTPRVINGQQFEFVIAVHTSGPSISIPASQSRNIGTRLGPEARRWLALVAGHAN
jgi:V8-like Glu-specific endopeptidase